MGERNIQAAKNLLVRTLEDILYKLKYEGCERLDEDTTAKNLEYLEATIDYLEQVKLY
jgi:hypothetical protein